MSNSSNLLPPRICFLSLFLILAILIAVSWHVIVLLICVALKSIDAEYFSHVYFAILYILFSKMSVHVFYPFSNCVVFFIVSFDNFLYILDSSPLLHIWFTNIFSPNPIFMRIFIINGCWILSNDFSASWMWSHDFSSLAYWYDALIFKIQTRLPSLK